MCDALAEVSAPDIPTLAALMRSDYERWARAAKLGKLTPE